MGFGQRLATEFQSLGQRVTGTGDHQQLIIAPGLAGQAGFVALPFDQAKVRLEAQQVRHHLAAVAQPQAQVGARMTLTEDTRQGRQQIGTDGGAGRHRQGTAQRPFRLPGRSDKLLHAIEQALGLRQQVTSTIIEAQAAAQPLEEGDV